MNNLRISIKLTTYKAVCHYSHSPYSVIRIVLLICRKCFVSQKFKAWPKLQFLQWMLYLVWFSKSPGDQRQKCYWIGGVQLEVIKSLIWSSLGWQNVGIDSTLVLTVVQTVQPGYYSWSDGLLRRGALCGRLRLSSACVPAWWNIPPYLCCDIKSSLF